MTLTMTAHGIGDDDVADEVTAYFHNQPQLNGITNMELCAGDSVMFAGVEAEHYASLAWHTGGDGQFADVATLNPVYHPGDNEVAAGMAELTLQLEALGMCEDLTMASDVTIHSLPQTQIASGTYEVCEQSNYVLTGMLEGAAPWELTVNNELVEASAEELAMEVFVTSDSTLVISHIKDNNGCENSAYDTVNIVMAPLPSVAMTPEGNDSVDLVFESSSTFTTTHAQHASGYEWEILPEDAGTVSADDTTATVEWSSSFTGEAAVQVTAVNDCGAGAASEALKVDVRNTVGYGEEQLEGMLKIYPNPAEGRFYIEQTAAFERTVTVTVLNPLSEPVLVRKNIDLSAGRVTIDLTNQGKGVYLLMIDDGDNRRVVKRLINR